MSPFWSVPSSQRFSVCSRDRAAVTTVPSLTIFSFSVTHKGTLQWPPEYQASAVPGIYEWDPV